MKQLIVNADDLGAEEDRNAGIFDAIEAGCVTGVSILPNGPALKDALIRIRALNSRSISFGIHLNLSEGRPVESGLRRIPGSDGSFRGKIRALRLLSQRGDPGLEQEIRREFAAQIKRILDAGVPVDHLDGHQHVHILPAAAFIAAEAAALHGIPWTRIPEEPVPESAANALPPHVMEEAAFFSRNAAAARAGYRAAGVHASAHFRGLYYKGELPSENWAGFMESVMLLLDALAAGEHAHLALVISPGGTDINSDIEVPERRAAIVKAISTAGAIVVQSAETENQLLRFMPDIAFERHKPSWPG